jgi:hypothetical protein
MDQATGVRCPNVPRGTVLANSNHKNVTIAILAFLGAAPYSLEQLSDIVGKRLVIHGANVSGYRVCVT